MAVKCAFFPEHCVQETSGVSAGLFDNVAFECLVVHWSGFLSACSGLLVSVTGVHHQPRVL